MTFYINEQSPKSNNKSYPSFNSRLLKELPIIQCSKSSKVKMVELSKSILNKTNNYSFIINETKSFLSSKFDIDKLTTKLQNWHQLTFGEFLKELTKQKVVLSLNEQAAWMQYFNEQKQKALALKTEIDKTDNEIDAMVYELYGLTAEEIAIVEEATQ